MPNRRDSADVKVVDEVKDFVVDIVGDEYLKVEEDLGSGFVRLCTSEAERRQAAQDIRTSEDVLIEMLRNSRDAGARNIFVATQKEGSIRSIIVLDDGDGIPEKMHEKVFSPRVTSKLTSAHFDKWGMHGRGMALYSIAVNAKRAFVAYSREGKGASIEVEIDCKKLSEKRDQSTFPIFKLKDGAYSFRGPKNLLRTAAEFAIEHSKEINVYLGSITEVTSTIYHHGVEAIPASQRLFYKGIEDVNCIDMLSFNMDASTLAVDASRLGLDISQRSAKRILDGEIEPLIPLDVRVKRESFSNSKGTGEVKIDSQNISSIRSGLDLASKISDVRLSDEDLEELRQSIMPHISELAEKYYLQDAPLKIKQKKDHLIVDFELIDNR